MYNPESCAAQQRIEEGDAVAAAQHLRSQQLDKAATATAQRLDLLASRLDRALQWNENLEARVSIESNLKMPPLIHEQAKD